MPSAQVLRSTRPSSVGERRFLALVWFLFPEGIHTVGDGGTLDLGIVRDSTPNATNNYEFFAESFEAIIPKVIESWKVTSNLCDTGAGAIDITDACAGTS